MNEDLTTDLIVCHECAWHGRICELNERFCPYCDTCLVRIHNK